MTLASTNVGLQAVRAQSRPDGHALAELASLVSWNQNSSKPKTFGNPDAITWRPR